MTFGKQTDEAEAQSSAVRAGWEHPPFQGRQKITLSIGQEITSGRSEASAPTT
jgi:hypothetical protein